MSGAVQTDIRVSFRDVCKSYDGRKLVIKNLNLDIRRGEFLTLLGPSGSGKTTALMMLAGFEAPTRGQIFLNGKPINNVPHYKRNIGVVFQNYALFPHMTVEENLLFPLKARKVPAAEARRLAAQALSMVRLDGFAGRRPAQLSGGQQQRVALARALVFEPPLVAMDEPLGALDRQLREQMQLEIKHLHDQLGLTVVYVTHDQGEALTMSDRIAVSHDGAIQQLDTPDRIYECPAMSFVARFIGENNVLDGLVVAADGETCRVRLGDGTEVKARAVNINGVNAPTSLSIRPERVRLNSESNGLDNQIEGRIEEFIYFGDHVRIRLLVAGIGNFIVKVPVTKVDAGWRIGDRVPVGWSAQDVRALDPLT